MSDAPSDATVARAKIPGGVSPRLAHGEGLREPLGCTYRVQLTPEFGFRDLITRLPYLAQLGISHVYLSPCLEAVSGSAHGYDVTDPTRVREDFGGEVACAELLAACRENRLHVVMDIVPNHMAASPAHNPWWRDLLRWGKASPYARYFDVDWGRHEGRVLLPILGSSRRAALERGEVRLERALGSLLFYVEDQVLPVAACSLPLVFGGLALPGSALGARLRALEAASSDLGATRAEIEASEAEVWQRLSSPEHQARAAEALAELNASPERLQAVLEAQHYRLRFWRAGLDEINYRRFFDVSSLAALRVQDQEVFDAVHIRARCWLAEGVVTGVRVDHPDGLEDPEQYFERLRELVGDGWVLAEKILASGEQLPRSWPVDGTTGYDFADVAGRLFVDPSAEADLTATYCRLAELPSYDLRRSVHAAKGRALRELFGAEVASLTARALPACQPERGRASSAGDVQRALLALITGLPVYRTYVRPGQQASESDRAWLEVARRHAVAELPELAPLVGRLVELLLGSAVTARHDALAMAFQQLSGPAMAKGLEDTVFYDDARLLALNEVGSDPTRFGADVEEFHTRAGHVQAHWPRTLSATSTHDTKRSEDVRLRIALLSEVPTEWALRSEAWMRRARGLAGGASVDPRTLYFMLQTLVGAWPISLARFSSYLLKAVREAKAWTSWLSPDLTREAALGDLARALLEDATFGAELSAFVARLEPAFVRHSLALALLKLTAPGVPDIYQGTELWDFSLADPDNRRPVDYPLRERSLSGFTAPPLAAGAPGALALDVASGVPERLLASAHGEAKLWTIARALSVRRAWPDCFDEGGAYTPLSVVGAEQHRVVAFQRGTRVVTVAPRLTFSLSGWRDTCVVLPEGRFVNVLTGERVSAGGLSPLLAQFPVALLVAD